jgi:hypothetical protein
MGRLNQLGFFYFYCCFFIIFIAQAAAKPTQNDSVTVIPGEQYKAGSLHRWFFGSGYREVWTTPVRVPVLNLDTFAGGLTPIRRGGGLQTNSLRFQSGDGRVLVFRTVDKFPGRALPPDLKGTVIETLGKDQVGLMLPFGALVVSKLAVAVGVLHSPPYYCLMPDDAKLGEFRSDFAGFLGSVEERPDEADGGGAGFGNSEKIVNSNNFSEALDSSPNDNVDTRAYLNARLLDIIVGDWDRHADQWRWARYEEGKSDIWRPIARDRDFAFVLYDGILPYMLDRRWANRDIESFDLQNPDMISLEHKSRFLDVRLLNTYGWQDWEVVIADFTNKLTDTVIENAVRALPPEIYDIVGEEIVKKLKLRRDNMQTIARDYYEIVSAYIDIQTTNKAECVHLERLAEGDVRVTITRKNDRDVILLDRTFYKKETEEVRLYLLGGDDWIEVSGKNEGGIIIRIIGGKGDDRLIELDAVKDIHFYDTRKGAELSQRKNASVTLSKKEVAHDRPPVGYAESRLTRSLQGEKLRPPYDYGYVSMPLPYFGYDVDNGFYIGAGIQRTYYRFRADPYASLITLFGDYSFRTGALYLRYEGDYRAFIPGAWLETKIKTSLSGDKPNFFGYGNTTEPDEELDKDYYKTPIDIFESVNDVVVNLISSLDVKAGIEYQYLKTHDDKNTFVTDSNRVHHYLAETKHTIGLRIGLEYDTRDNETAPLRGIYLFAGTSYFPNLIDNKNDFVTISALLKGFYSPLSKITLGGRLATEKIYGTFPYYRAAYIGGGHSLRGFKSRRFAGDQAVSGTAEIRLHVTRQRIIFPSDMGLFIYSDGGRVWYGQESPGKWHITGGAGLYIAPLMRDFTIRASLARSDEGTRFYWDLGFAF